MFRDPLALRGSVRGPTGSVTALRASVGLRCDPPCLCVLCRDAACSHTGSTRYTARPHPRRPDGGSADVAADGVGGGVRGRGRASDGAGDHAGGRPARVHARRGRGPAPARGRVQGRSEGRQSPRIHEGDLGRAAPRRIGRVDAGGLLRPEAVHELGPRRLDRAARGAHADARRARGRARRARAVHGRPEGARRARGPGLGGRRTARDLQRLFRRRRRHRRGRLRELRRAGRLRRAGEAGHRRGRQDRDRALRRKLARHQAQGRRRARRGGLPHLLGSERRWVLPGRCVPGRPLPDGAGRAARERHGHAAPSGRPADAGLGRREGASSIGTKQPRS